MFAPYSINADGHFVGEPLVARFGSSLESVVPARVVGNRVVVRLFGSTGGHSWADAAWIFQRLSDGSLLGEGRVEIPSNGMGDSVCHTRVDSLAFDGARIGGLVRADPEWRENDREISAELGMRCDAARVFVRDQSAEPISTVSASLAAEVVDATFEGDTLVALVSQGRGRGVVIRVAPDGTRSESLIASGTTPPAPFDAPRLVCTSEGRALHCDVRTLTGTSLSDSIQLETGALRDGMSRPIELLITPSLPSWLGGGGCISSSREALLVIDPFESPNGESAVLCGRWPSRPSRAHLQAPCDPVHAQAAKPAASSARVQSKRTAERHDARERQIRATSSG